MVKQYGSLINDGNSDDDLTPQQLSGDQNAEGSIVMSAVQSNKANFFLSVMTIMKTIIGAGILSLPFTSSRLGYVINILMFIIVISIIQFTSVLLLKAKNLSKHSNYSTIIQHIFRSKIAHSICSFMILFQNTGVCIADILILKGSITRIFDNYIQQNRDNFFLSPIFIVLVCTVLQLPFSLVNKIQKLKMFAFIGVSGITIFVLVFTVVFFVLMGENRNWTCSKQMIPVGQDFLKIIMVIPNIIFALTYSTNFFPVFKGLKNANDAKMSRASLVGICACSLFYVTVGNMGFCLFGKSKLQANFLLSFEPDELNAAAYFILNITFLSSVFCSFPIIYFAARNNFIAIINNFLTLFKKDDKKGQQNQGEESSSYIETLQKIKRRKYVKIQFYVFSILLYAFIMIVAASVDDIESVFNILGSISSNAICFIFPSLFYFMLVRIKKKEKKAQYYFSICLIVFFIPFGIFSVISKYLQVQD